jgi:UDP-N-acetyl-D-mannosaminuronate dehydrogenase
VALVDLLHRAGADVLIHDPLFTPGELAHLKAGVVELDSEDALKADAVIVQAWHHAFRKLDWSRFEHLRAVLDGRGAVDPSTVRAAGAAYLAVGLKETRAGSPT